MGVEAATAPVTAIIGTAVCVIAIGGIGAWLTRASRAAIVQRTGVAIITRSGVRSVDAASSRVAAVIGASVAIIAIRRWTCLANTARTHIAGTTRATIIAAGGVVDIDTTSGWVTGVVGTHVFVIAIRSGSTHTGSR